MRTMGSLWGGPWGPSRYYSRGHCGIKNFPQTAKARLLIQKEENPQGCNHSSPQMSLTRILTKKWRRDPVTHHRTSVLYMQCLISAPRVCLCKYHQCLLPLPPLPCRPSLSLAEFSLISLSLFQFLLFAQLPLNASYKHTGLETHISHLPWLHFS